jgi:hypothetical protein
MTFEFTENKTFLHIEPLTSHLPTSLWGSDVPWVLGLHQNPQVQAPLDTKITLHCTKKVCGFPVPSRDVTYQTLGQGDFSK